MPPKRRSQGASKMRHKCGLSLVLGQFGSQASFLVLFLVFGVPFWRFQASKSALSPRRAASCVFSASPWQRHAKRDLSSRLGQLVAMVPFFLAQGGKAEEEEEEQTKKNIIIRRNRKEKEEA